MFLEILKLLFASENLPNLPVSLPVKEFGKSVNIWRTYGQEFSVLFFWDTVYSTDKIIIQTIYSSHN